MDKNLEFRFDSQQKIIYETLKGRIGLKDLVKNHRAKLSSPEYNNTYSYITDIRGVDFDLSLSDKADAYKNLKEQNIKNNFKRRCAIITSNPKEVVYSEIFQKNMKQICSLEFKTFSTEKAAYHWVKEMD